MDIYVVLTSRKIKPGHAADVMNWKYMAAFSNLTYAKRFVEQGEFTVEVGEWEVGNNGALHTVECVHQPLYTPYTVAYRIVKDRIRYAPVLESK